MHADFPAHLARDTCFIAQQKATPVGYAILTQDSGGQWWLENLAVHPTAQGQGIGGALIDHIESWLKPRTPAYHLYTPHHHDRKPRPLQKARLHRNPPRRN